MKVLGAASVVDPRVQGRFRWTFIRPSSILLKKATFAHFGQSVEARARTRPRTGGSSAPSALPFPHWLQLLLRFRFCSGLCLRVRRDRRLLQRAAADRRAGLRPSLRAGAGEQPVSVRPPGSVPPGSGVPSPDPGLRHRSVGTSLEVTSCGERSDRRIGRVPASSDHSGTGRLGREEAGFRWIRTRVSSG